MEENSKDISTGEMAIVFGRLLLEMDNIPINEEKIEKAMQECKKNMSNIEEE